MKIICDVARYVALMRHGDIGIPPLAGSFDFATWASNIKKVAMVCLLKMKPS